MLATLEGPLLHPWTFHVMRLGVEVATIRKQWSGLGREMFTDADTFGVEMSRSLTDARPVRVTPDPSTCPRCGAPRASGPAAPEATWGLDAEELAVERKLRLFAVPVALAVAWLLMNTGMGHAIGRIFASMWIHELGHAVTAWACGIPAFPGPWRTIMGEGRSVLVILLWAGGEIGLGVWAWRSERRGWIPLAAALVVIQLICAGALSLRSANALVVFMGDGGCMVLGAALAMTFYARAGSSMRRGWLRWGFLVIGALAMMDASETWWGAARDSERIPFGEIEGVGLSDPSRLQDVFGWSTLEMTHRYVALSLGCLAALAAVYAWGARHADVDSSLPE